MPILKTPDPGSGSRMNALTIDLEDWYHPELVRGCLKDALPEGRLSRTVPPVLELLTRYGIKATFFILGESASRFPALVRRIHEEGHEIGCHGMSHRMLKDIGPKGLERELSDFRTLMKEILGEVQIRGFRAPTFSLNMETRWALPVLKDFGYRYDSSVFPAKLFWNPLYGMECAPRLPYPVSFEDPGREDARSPIWEFPGAIARWMGIDLPVCGGFYLRTLPAVIFRRGLQTINRKGPFFIYLHPWEWDPDLPRVPMPFLAAKATYYGVRKTFVKLEGLLRVFSFSRMDQVLERMGALR
jgi:polysaccharide deacetylase family protein (PEP-CTERM system associated)